MADILMCCESIEERFKTKRNVFEKCARDRLIRLYEDENKDFDNLLNKLEVSIDYNSENDVKKCVTKLLRMLGSDRKNLMKILRRIY